jgi:hypothetical protein
MTPRRPTSSILLLGAVVGLSPALAPAAALAQAPPTPVTPLALSAPTPEPNCPPSPTKPKGSGGVTTGEATGSPGGNPNLVPK